MPNNASVAQINYLTGLLRQQAEFDRDRSVAMWNELRDLESKDELTSSLVSRHIDAVRQSIRVQGRGREGRELMASVRPRVEVPEGRYAVRGDDDKVRFYHVKRYPSGATLLFVQAGDEEHRITKGAMRAVLQGIWDAGVDESGLLYGRELGACDKCGRTLTDDESRARGRGPICAGLA